MRASAFVVATAAFLAASCGGGDQRSSGPTLRANVRCDGASFQVAFDPADGVTMTGGGHTLASATFDERSVDDGCVAVREARAFSDDLLGAGVYRRLTLECAIPAKPVVQVHPIVGDGAAVVGSVLSVAVPGPRLVVSAVLKNRGDPAASRVYFAEQYCHRT
jgi:hypothetical protein